MATVNINIPEQFFDLNETQRNKLLQLITTIKTAETENTTNIETNKTDITNLNTGVANMGTQQIENTANIATNTTNIATNTANIATNLENAFMYADGITLFDDVDGATLINIGLEVHKKYDIYVNGGTQAENVFQNNIQNVITVFVRNFDASYNSALLYTLNSSSRIEAYFRGISITPTQIQIVGNDSPIKIYRIVEHDFYL